MTDMKNANARAVIVRRVEGYMNRAEQLQTQLDAKRALDEGATGSATAGGASPSATSAASSTRGASPSLGAGDAQTARLRSSLMST